MSKQVEDADVKVDGNTAKLVSKDKPDDKHPLTLTKAADGWKVDLKAIREDPGLGQVREMAPKVSAAVDAVTKDVEAGKYKTVQEAFMAFGETMQKIAAMAEPPQKTEAKEDAKPEKKQ